MEKLEFEGRIRILADCSRYCETVGGLTLIQDKKTNLSHYHIMQRNHVGTLSYDELGDDPCYEKYKYHDEFIVLGRVLKFLKPNVTDDEINYFLKLSKREEVVEPFGKYDKNYYEIFTIPLSVIAEKIEIGVDWKKWETDFSML